MVPTLKTERLLLRRFRQEDAAAVAALAGSWDVARMLARIPHPYTRDMAETWIATHGRLGESGEEYIFCIERDGETVGSIGLQRSRDGVYELGYWLGESWWGEGLASEAARRIVRWAFEDLGADGLVSGHLADNPASGRVLKKCGFRYTGDSDQHSVARGGLVSHRDFALDRAAWSGEAEAP
jgi:RimJ/RimL family protein N-acetyltransferase